MKLIKPPVLVTQGFGENANPLYAGQGLKGHSGIDFAYQYGQPIPAFTDAYCYSVLNRGNPNLMAYRAVFTIVEDPDFVYEVSYGHCSTIQAQVNSKVFRGVTVAECGNLGDVFQGGHKVTEEEKEAGSHAGAHLHFQVRKLRKVAKTNSDRVYVYDGNGIYHRDGVYLEVVDYDNGYNGCVDPMPFFDSVIEQKYLFNRNLGIGYFGIDVMELQKRLGVSPTWPMFGPKTRAAVIHYQQAHGITPTGFVGSLTRASLNI